MFRTFPRKPPPLNNNLSFSLDLKGRKLMFEIEGKFATAICCANIIEVIRPVYYFKASGKAPWEK